jgi:polysaccharide deacetylase family protein (PEP-CTERM system associated)
MRILTFDIEEWFHCDLITGTAKWDSYERRLDFTTERILNALEQRKQRATFYILGWAARRFPDVVRAIHDAGHEIGCHSDMHQMVFQVTREQFQKDTKRSLDSIQGIIGKKVVHYRAPAFSITPQSPWAFEVLVANGIQTDSSIFPAQRDYGGYSGMRADGPFQMSAGGTGIWEFPINVMAVAGKPIVFSGGGYFRLFPYWLIDRWTRNSPYVMSYFHPRDFDAEQPVLGHLPLHRKFKSYYGLKGAWRKFERWLDAEQWVSVGEAVRRFSNEGTGGTELGREAAKF